MGHITAAVINQTKTSITGLCLDRLSMIYKRGIEWNGDRKQSDIHTTIDQINREATDGTQSAQWLISNIWFWTNGASFIDNASVRCA
jgi:hypothetical protein